MELIQPITYWDFRDHFGIGKHSHNGRGLESSVHETFRKEDATMEARAHEASPE